MIHKRQTVHYPPNTDRMSSTTGHSPQDSSPLCRRNDSQSRRAHTSKFVAGTRRRHDGTRKSPFRCRYANTATTKHTRNDSSPKRDTDALNPPVNAAHYSYDQRWQITQLLDAMRIESTTEAQSSRLNPIRSLFNSECYRAILTLEEDSYSPT
jgi:hypothetical protein